MTLARRTREPTMAEVWPLLLTRSGGRCECCGEAFTPYNPAEAHHRLTRRHGSNRMSNLMMLRRWCHLYAPGAPHFSPAAARDAGWVISRHDRRHPSQIPMRYRDGQLYLPTDEGVLTLWQGDPE